MHGVRVIRSILIANTGVTSKVAAGNIQGDVAPEGAALPMIMLQSISCVPLGTLARGSTMHFRERVQVTPLAAEYDALGSIVQAIADACSHRFPVLSGLQLVSVIADGIGPDSYEPLTMARSKTMDFIVRYNV